MILSRQGLTLRGQLVTRRYIVHNVDVRLIIQSVANSLGILLRIPMQVSMAFPKPEATLGVGDSVPGGGTGNNGGSSSSVASANGASGSTGEDSAGSENSSSSSSGGVTKGRWVPSLPMDTPLSKGGFDKALQSAIYQDRADNAIVEGRPKRSKRR